MMNSSQLYNLLSVFFACHTYKDDILWEVSANVVLFLLMKSIFASFHRWFLPSIRSCRSQPCRYTFHPHGPLIETRPGLVIKAATIRLVEQVVSKSLVEDKEMKTKTYKKTLGVFSMGSQLLEPHSHITHSYSHITRAAATDTGWFVFQTRM